MVDLDKLSAELTAADYEVTVGDDTVHVRLWGDNDGKPGILVQSEGWVDMEITFQGAGYWPVIDIIRRHVSPVAPDPGLREAIVKAMKSCVYPCGTYEIPVTNHEKAATAVLAVLAERGMA